MKKEDKIVILKEEKFYNQIIKPVYVKGRGLQDVFTPRQLIDKIIKKLKDEINSFDNLEIAVLFNIGFVFSLIKFGAKPEKIWFFCDSDEKEYLIKKMYNNKINLVRIYYSKKWGIEFMLKKQFDVVVMNPPYQSGSGNKGKGNIRWDKFVEVGNNLVVENGSMAFVHPSLWRKPDHSLRKAILSNQVDYLEMHDEKDGKKTFGAQTRYDWYVARKTSDKGMTRIVDQNGKKFDVDIQKLPFIPNSDFDRVFDLLPQNGEARIEILNDRSAYGADKDWVSNKKNGMFKHPCVYMVRKDNSLSLKWSRKKNNGHFGIPKLIYGSGEGCMSNFYVDAKGEYGLTQWASGIVDSPSTLPKIAKAMKSKEFQKLLPALSMSKTEINTSVLRCFRKDFWKNFV